VYVLSNGDLGDISEIDRAFLLGCGGAAASMRECGIFDSALSEVVEANAKGGVYSLVELGDWKTQALFLPLTLALFGLFFR
jgi:hypothetical protein